jgi:malate dehydrogenase (oxaloacetate-decarboxylating)(NADP+)
LDKGTYCIADTNVNYDPTAAQLAEISMMAAKELMRFGIMPKVALVSHSNFGSMDTPSAVKLREALQIIRHKMPDLECDGEMQADSALIEDIRHRLYPKSYLKGEANLLVMPNLDAANITYNALRALANGVVVGPILLGMRKPVHILTRTVTTRGVVNLSALAAADAYAGTVAGEKFEESGKLGDESMLSASKPS